MSGIKRELIIHATGIDTVRFVCVEIKKKFTHLHT